MAPIRLARLLRPQSIAVVGGKEAQEVVRQCLKMGFAGTVWPVHPEKKTVLEVPCFASVSELPQAPDAVFLGVNRHLSVDLVGELSRMGAGGAMCYASGFNESGSEGDRLARDLVEAAGDMPVLGPNCYGLINYLDGALLWPDQHGGRRCDRGVAIVSQSSNMTLNLTMQQRGVPLAYAITLGNQLCIGMSEVIEALVEDERVSAIGLHIEGVDDAVRLDRVVRYAREAGKPMVAFKVGRSSAAQALTRSHTASVAGGNAPFSALLRRMGVGEVRSIPAFLETLKLLHYAGPIARRDIVSFSCSGGEASLIADAAWGRNVSFKPFTPEQARRVAATVNPLVEVSNPFDYHTFDWGNEERLHATFMETLACDFGAAILILDVPREDRCDATAWLPTLEAFSRAVETTSTPGIVLSSMPENLPENWVETWAGRGLVGMWTMEDTLTAVETAADIGECWKRPAPGPLADSGMLHGETRTLSEYESKGQLAMHGIPVPASMICGNTERAVEAARSLGYPVAVKVAGAHVAHKTELGGVALNIAGDADLEAVARRLFSISDAVLVESMVTGGVAELLVGAARDPVVGLYLVIGAGGVGVEWMKDRSVLTLPATDEEIDSALRGLQCFPLLNGFRGRPNADIDAVIDAVRKVEAFVFAHHRTLMELDINPLIVRAENQGCCAADALVVILDDADRLP